VSYVHDIGGRYGFGAVPGLDDEAAFHAAWEARIFGILRSLIHNGAFTWDEFRHAVEQTPPAAYLASGYFERWADAMGRLAVHKGLITEDDLAAARAAMREPA
jgi:nitrile hydratase